MGIDTVEEHWKEIPGYEGIYSVSNQGRVRRDSPGRSTYVGRILSSKHASGYPQVRLCDNSIATMHKVHTLVAEAFLGLRPPSGEVNHLSGDKSDNRPENLEWTTRQGNVDHAKLVLGTGPGNRKLKEKDIPRIRNLYATGQYSQTDLGNLYGVGYTAIAGVVYGQTWQHIHGGPIQAQGFRKNKLTREGVLAIRQLHTDGMTMTAIARQFRVSLSCVSLIVRRKRWASLPEANHDQ